MHNIANKTILITGGTGSLGQHLLQTMLKSKDSPRKIIIFSRDEFKQHNMRLNFLNKIAATDEVIYSNFLHKVQFQIGDVRDFHSIARALKNVDVVFNTAAIKQVPVAEYYPDEALKTNVIGVENIINAISEYDLPVETVMGISTDKACKPINAYGMTKALMEREIIAANIKCPNTRFILVRYGNVMASRGSVIPLFIEQIRTGKDITITDHKMTRFMMNLDQAVETVITAYNFAYPGEIYVPKISSAKIIDVAKSMMGESSLPIKEIGIRPGEKLHESLISREEMLKTYHRANYYVIPSNLPELKCPYIANRSSDQSADWMEEYTSESPLLRIDEIKVLLKNEGLLP